MTTTVLSETLQDPKISVPKVPALVDGPDESWMDGLLFHTLAAVAAPLAHSNIASGATINIGAPHGNIGAVVAVAASTTATRAAARVRVAGWAAA